MRLKYIILVAILCMVVVFSVANSKGSSNRKDGNSLATADAPYIVKRSQDQLKYPSQIQTSEKGTIANLTSKVEVQLPLDVPLIHQMEKPRLYNGCEVTSLAMILRYHGLDVSKNELAHKIAHVPLTYSTGLKGNPNQGFVGDMENGPGLGVYHGPIYDLAKKYVGDKAIDITGEQPEDIYKHLDQGLPVWIIISTSYAPVRNFRTWETPKGEVDVTFSVHSVAVTGYDEQSVYVNDPYGEKNKKVDKHQFELAWKQMGQQAIVITK